MPLYDYQCQGCQNVFEVRATFKDKEEGLKPDCHELRLIESNRFSLYRETKNLIAKTLELSKIISR